MTTTAAQRRCPSRRCTRSINGQVATTKVVAQIVAGRNGHRIQNEVAISPVTNRIARMVRTRSRWPSAAGGSSAMVSLGACAGTVASIRLNAGGSGISPRIKAGAGRRSRSCRAGGRDP